MKTNVAIPFTEKTHEGATAARMNAEQSLRRSVMACMLWEDEFYEDGVEIGARIEALAKTVPCEKLAAIAIEAREKMKLRHAPLWLTVAALKNKAQGRQVGDLISRVCQRADEPAELLAMYWKSQKDAPLTKQLKVGLARALAKFDEHQLAKNNKDGAVKLRDVLFLSHAKPTEARADLYKRIAEKKLATPDTWEVALSGGADKKETFERLMAEGNLGGLAFLRNLRNMEQAGVSKSTVAAYGPKVKLDRVLPFRFISAARAVPQWEDVIEPLMLKALGAAEKLKGRTALVVDNSGSMQGARVSSKSDITRADAACALAILVREIAEDALIIGFGSSAAVMPNRRGFGLADAIKRGPGGGTDTRTAVALANGKGYDRIIIITDEQSHTAIGAPLGKGYVINVASNKNGIGYGAWTHIDGWSEAVIDYIRQAEAQ
jgi:hypothetical protein